MIKQKIKALFGKIQSKRFKIQAGNNVYIGRHCDLKGKQNIVMEDGVTVCPYVQIWSGEGGKIKLGNGSVIGERCRISIANSLDVGKKVLFSPNIYITDCDHEYRNINIPVMDQGIV